jgi:hypothetical protein
MRGLSAHQALSIIENTLRKGDDMRAYALAVIVLDGTP